MAYKLMSPLASIVIPSYNVGKYLQEAVESVIKAIHPMNYLFWRTDLLLWRKIVRFR